MGCQRALGEAGAPKALAEAPEALHGRAAGRHRGAPEAVTHHPPQEDLGRECVAAPEDPQRGVVHPSPPGEQQKDDHGR